MALQSRRQRFGHQKKGSEGYVTSRRPFNLTFGKRSGTKIPTNIRRGSDGFDDVDDFFGGDETNDKEQQSYVANVVTPSTGAVSKSSSGRTNGTASHKRQTRSESRMNRANKSSPHSSVVPSPALVSPNKRLSFGQNADVGVDDSFEDDGGDMIMEASFDAEIDDTATVDVDIEDEESNEVVPEPETNLQDLVPEEALSSESDDDSGDDLQKRVLEKKKPVSKKKKINSKVEKVPKRKRGDGSFKASRQSLGPASISPLHDGATRRSKRRRWQPLEYWRGERLTFSGHTASSPLPSVKGAERIGVPTPKLKRTRKPNKPTGKKKNSKSKRRKMKKKESGSTDSEDVSDNEEPVDLPKGYEITKGNAANVWKSEGKNGKAIEESLEVIRLNSEMQFRELAPSVPRKDDSAVALASGAFDEKKFVSGVVKLRPGAFKDVESVRSCTQVFYVISGQAKSVEFKVAEEKFILSPGDHFYVPPHNTYGLRNFSKTTEASLTFVVIKPSDM